MKSLSTVVHPPNHPMPYLFMEDLPIGFRVCCWKESSGQLNFSVPATTEPGLLLTFINYKGELQIASGAQRDRLQQASPGLALLSPADEQLIFSSSGPIQFSAVALFIPDSWVEAFLRNNPNFIKIRQALEMSGDIITCRLGRRQLSLFGAIVSYKREDKTGLLGIQNHGLSLLEYFLCSRHRSLSGINAVTGVDNEDDLSLVREVESYISEYYCSDTFTVDSILKKTYTSYHKLNFLFKSIHGMTISEYIRNKRIEKSKEMIADNVKSISQIAYEIGYSSISNYILAFKKIYQITPGKYKKQIDNLA